MNVIRLFLLSLSCLSVNSMHAPLKWLRKPVACIGFAAFLQCNPGSPLLKQSFAAIDCNSDCFKNCAKAAPGSTDYCKESCQEYCSQDDREDGLSGSVSARKGETGIFGGSIDGTVTKQSDRPPRGIEIIPNDLIKQKKIRSN